MKIAPSAKINTWRSSEAPLFGISLSFVTLCTEYHAWQKHGKIPWMDHMSTADKGWGLFSGVYGNIISGFLKFGRI